MIDIAHVLRRAFYKLSIKEERLGSSKAKSREELEEELLRIEVEARRFEITERRFGLFRRAVLLVMTGALIAVTVYCTLEDAHSTIPLVTGPTRFATDLLPSRILYDRHLNFYATQDTSELCCTEFNVPAAEVLANDLVAWVVQRRHIIILSPRLPPSRFDTITGLTATGPGLAVRCSDSSTLNVA